MNEKLIISGFGGQGVLSAGLMIAGAAVTANFNSTFFPSYGAEMRGGTANCNVIISDFQIASPIVSIADSLIAMNEPSLEKFLPSVKEDGLVIVNSSVVKKEFDYGNRIVKLIPIEDMAFEKIGNVKTANVIMVGIYITKKVLIKLDGMKSTIKEMFIKKGEKIVEMNFRALELGASLA